MEVRNNNSLQRMGSSESTDSGTIIYECVHVYMEVPAKVRRHLEEALKLESYRPL